MEEFLGMGGYGAYVWSAYGLTFLVMLGLFLDSRLRLKKAESEFERLDAARKAARQKRS